MLARTRKPTRETPVPTLFSYSPESVDDFGAALLEFAKMNRGQARQERALADAADAGEADEVRPAGVREEAANQRAGWLAAARQDGRDAAFLLGGADGLAPTAKSGAGLLLRLSAMTLPHALARVLLAEQLYRASSILHKHPYHRE